MKTVSDMLSRIAVSNATVLLTGESGVGKSLVAKQLHSKSSRKEEPFIEINCSTIPETLFESEMFGYVAGAFTGARSQGRQGLIEQAHKGTLFLDEIGELSLNMQVKLLKVLQDKKLIKVGGQKELSIDFRLVAATNQNLEELVRQGKFRSDLYYRLHVIPVTIPSLRERREDIPVFISYFLQKFNAKYGSAKTLSPFALECLNQYDWPGNVRELENLIERLVLTSDHHVISPEQLPFFLKNSMKKDLLNEEVLQQDSISIHVDRDLDYKKTLERVEKQLLYKAYEQFKTTYEIARQIGISQPSVSRKLKQYNITP
jgi:TyrR family helix-turn-helix protein